MRPHVRLLAALAVASAALVGVVDDGRPTIAPAAAQPATSARYQLGGDAYAGLPFVLAVVVEGFDDAPAPAQPMLTVPGAQVSPLGVDHREAATVIINGRRIDQGGGTWVLKYRIEVGKGGALTLPSLTVTQGGKTATAAGGRLPVADLDGTTDMAIELALPQRAVYVGETIPVEIAWLLRKDPQDQTLNVPLLGQTDAFAITALPPRNPRQTLSFPAGGRDLDLGYEQDQIARGGDTYTRLRFEVQVTPLKVGTIAIAPAQVVARLQTGVGRDAFGFATARTALFRASDQPRTLEVRALPETGKPDSFGGAVGGSFSLAVAASRSVVQLGEPVELELTIKSDRRLDTVGLPRLDGPGGLPRDKFQVPDEAPIGELSADGLSKKFKVSAQVIGPATEIPALAFSYFDPGAATYQTIHSEPIALSVKGGSVVGADQVVGGKPSPAGGSGPPSASGTEVSLVGVDLALSPPGAGGGGRISRGALWAVVGLLYAVPLLIFGLRVYRARTAGRRELAGEARAALAALRAAIERARTAPAKEAAVALPRALRTAARALGRPVDDALIARIEDAGFAPGAGDDPLASELRAELTLTLDGLAGRRSGGGRATAAALVLLALTAPGVARADDAVAIGRGEYQAALDASEPMIRQRNFAAAAAAFAQAARERPSAPMYADWGNAALGAGDLGGAALAYRRALALDGDLGRARRNLAWLRTRLPANLRPAAEGASETLFFFHGWRRDLRLLVGATAFALAVLVLVPWSGTRRRSLTPLAIAAGLAWAAMMVSLAVEGGRSADAVVMQAAMLRTADSVGAPTAMSAPVPAGVEVVVVERRGDWTRIELASGATGWLPTGVVERVAH